MVSLRSARILRTDIRLEAVSAFTRKRRGRFQVP